MTRKEFKEIIDTLTYYGVIDPYEAMINQQYLIYVVNMYIEARNVVKEMICI